MAFFNLGDRFSRVFSGRVGKRRTPPRATTPVRTPSVKEQKKAVAPLTPTSLTKPLPVEVVVKAEPANDDFGNVFGDVNRRETRRIDVETYEVSDVDSFAPSAPPTPPFSIPSVLPSIERTPSPEEEDEDEEDEEDPDGSFGSPDASSLSPYCDWDLPPGVLHTYEAAKKAVKGSKRWTATESTLHRLLGLRGYHPLIPGSWRLDFSGLLMDEILFNPVKSSHEVVLRCISEGMTKQFHATKALGRIFSLPAFVSDLRRAEEHVKSAGLIEREIRRYLNWAERDAGLDKLEYASNIGVYQFNPDANDSSNQAESLDQLLSQWASEYRAWYTGADIHDAPSTLFALVIMQHVVLVLTVDSKRPGSPAKCFAELDMSRSDGRWLDHALNLAIPIHLARDGMLRVKEYLAPKDIIMDDPDL